MENFNAQQEAQQLEGLCAAGHGDRALDELQSMSRQEQQAVIRQMKQDANQEGGKVYVDAQKDQLVFDSPFNDARR